MKKKRRLRVSNGVITAFALTTLFAMTVLGFAYGSRGTLALNQVYVSRQYQLAYYAAQSGIMLTIEAEQQSDANLPPYYNTGCPANATLGCGCSVSTSTSALSSVSSLIPIQLHNQALQGTTLPYTFANNATMTITITNNTASPTQCVGNTTAPDGTTVPVGFVYITSSGTAQGRTRTAKVMVAVTPGTPGTTPVDFNYALFAQTTNHLNNNVIVDSYNSNYGAYNCSCGGVGCSCSSGSNTGSKGNIGTNGNANSEITLSNNVNVKGEVDVGPGGSAGSPTISASNNANYSKAAVLSSPVTFPTVTDPVNGSPGGSDFNCLNGANCTISPNTLYNNITVSNNATLTMNGCGNYSMNSITLSNNGILTINCNNGTTDVFVHGANAPGNSPINFSNNTTVNQSGAPGTFQLYDISTATACGGARCTDNLANNGSLSTAMYAPNSNVQISNNGGFFGSAIGYSINILNNAGIHYDQALGSVQIGQGTAPTPAVVGNFTIWNFQ